ncbi:MAG: PAS domain-containing protein [Panacagrimonas sp.]
MVNQRIQQCGPLRPRTREQQFADSLPCMAWEIGPDGGVSWFNGCFCEYSGLEQGAGLGWDWTRIFHPDDLPRVEANWRESLRTGQPFRGQARFLRHDGVMRWHEMRTQPQPDASGQVRLWYGTAWDIDDLRSAQESLHDTEEMLHFGLDAAELGWWDLDLRSGRARRTLQHDRIFGYETLLPDWSYQRFLEHVVPEDRSRIDAQFEQAKSGSNLWDIQCRIRRADGMERHIWTRAAVRCDAGGAPVRLVGIVGDQTDLVRDRQARSEAIERARLLDAISEAIRVTDDPVEVMRATARLVGERLDVTRCAYADVEPDNDHFTIRDDWTADDAASTVGSYSLALFGRRALAELRGGRTLAVDDVDAELTFEDGAAMFNAIGIKAIVCCPLIKRDGLRGMMAVHSAVPRVWSAAEIGLVQVVAERSWAHIERVRAQGLLRENEARLSQLIDQIPAIIWTADAQGEIGYMSQWFLQFTGRPLEQMRSAYWPEFMHQDDVPGLIEVWGQCVATAAPYQYTARMLRSDGVYRWHTLRAQVVLDDQGKVLIWYGSGVDVHEEKQSAEVLALNEARLLALSEQLREADRRKDEFLATLAHELRNPLAPIRSGLSVLRHAAAGSVPAEPIAKPIYEMMERQTGQLVRLVDDLLEVSRITRGAIELKLEILDLAEVVGSAVETARPLIESARHCLSLHFPRGPARVRGDAVRLSQVFANLLNNAAKYTPEGGRIELVLGTESGQAVIRIVDSGIGIAPEMLPRVFEMFAQVERRSERAGGGLGIGLSLARSLVQLHGGVVEARSQGIGKGSEFVVRLPLAIAAAHEDAVASLPLRIPARRMLVVDDNRDAADSLGMLLETLGSDPRVVYSGCDALVALEQHRPAVAILDIGMPEMDGYELARRIRTHSLGRDMLLIALSGWGQEGDRRLSTEAGFDHHLVKPVDLDTLTGVLSVQRTNEGGA